MKKSAMKTNLLICSALDIIEAVIFGLAIAQYKPWRLIGVAGLSCLCYSAQIIYYIVQLRKLKK